MEKVKTPTMLWQNFNPNELELDVSEVYSYEADGILFKHFYFTGRQFYGESKSRVYGIVAYKNTKSSRPAVLLVSNPDKPIDECELANLATNGFVAMAIDTRGTAASGHYTIFPPDAAYANFCDGEKYGIKQSAEETMWYESTLNHMRAVTYLQALDFVKSISVLSQGQASLIALPLMAIDKRVSSGAVVFGNLHVELSGYIELDDKSDSEQMAQAISQNELLDIWTMGLAPQSYVPLVNIPVYVVCGGNSATVDVLSLSDTFLRLNDQSKLLVLPYAFDYLDDKIYSDIVKWLKGSKIPPQSKLNLSVAKTDDNILTVKVDGCADKKNVEVWYCRDNTKFGKNWVPATLQGELSQNTVCAQLDLYSHNSEVSVVALCTDSIAFSSPILNISTANQYTLKQPTSVLYKGESRFFVALNKTENWHGAELLCESAKGFLNIRGTKGRTICTFACQDQSVMFNDFDTLSFDICCDKKQTVKVSYILDFGKTNQTYVASDQLFGDGKWQRITLQNSQFKREKDGHTMPKSDKADLIVFDCEFPFIINNIYEV